jgi:hypothetical protein
VPDAGAGARRFGTLGASALLFALASITIADPDLWGHLRFGGDILASRRIPLVDPYSFTQDRPWINHEWLSESAMAAAYGLGGVTGLTILKGTLVFSTLLVVWRSLARSAVPVRLAVTGFVILGAGSVLAPMRPQLFSMLCFAMLARTLSIASARTRLWLPVLFALWANLHGGWIVGLGVTAAWALAAVVARRTDAIVWMLVAATSAAATLLTPYGVALWRFLWETVGFTRDITEWQPLLSQPVMNWLPVAVAVAASIVLLSHRGVLRRLEIGATLALLAVCAIRVSRIGPIVVVCAAILLAPEMARRWPMRSPIALDQAVDRRAAAGLGVAGIAAALAVASYSLTQIAVPAAPWTPPLAAAQRLAGASGRLVTFFDWGEYAIWHFGPRLRVSMDGRRETIYSDRRLAEHDAIVSGTAEGLAALAEWQAEYVWLPASATTTKAWLAGHGYRLDYEDADSFVAVRSDLPPRDDVADAGGAAPRNFPR